MSATILPAAEPETSGTIEIALIDHATDRVCPPPARRWNLLAYRSATWYFGAMTTTVEAIYENGVLKLPRPLPLDEKSPVLVTIQSRGDVEKPDERKAWLHLSEETLNKAWDNSADDIFNELLDR
jgi:predicted DNA-binding antitoxin AbrB/MazE fold protein